MLNKKNTYKNELNKNQKLKKDFFRQAVPSIASMWVSALYIMVDGMFVSKGVGPEALAAVNLTVPFVNTLFGLSVLFSIGTSTITSYTLGKGDKEKASEHFSLSLTFLTVLSIILSIISFIGLDKACIFLGASPNNIGIVKSYLGVIILFAPFYMVSYALEVLIKVDGYPQLSIVGVVVSAITNIVLDYLFVIKFGWGVEGAALATGLARVFSFIFFISHFLGSKSSLKFKRFNFELSIIRRVASIGFSDCITELSMGVIILLFNQCIIATIGDTGLIAYSVISYINTLVLSTMLGISQALQPLTSFYNGSGDMEAVKRLVKISLKTTAVFSVIILAVCVFFSDELVLMFIDKSDIEMFKYSADVLKLFSISFAILGFNVLTSGVLASIEKPKDASIISMSRGLVVAFITVIITISVFGGNGIWISTILSELIVLIYSAVKIKQIFKLS